jgi:hypothetical protein
MTLAGKTFRAIANTPNGTTGAETTMSFVEENGAVVRGVYGGGVIQKGDILAMRRTDAGLEMLYHCVTVDGELRAGQGLGVIAEDPDDKRLHLYLDWQWLTGDGTSGSSEWVLEP